MIGKFLFIFLLSILLGTSTERKGTKEFVQKESDIVGTLTIPKISLEQELYPIGHEENTIEKHVSILKESTSPKEENSIMILAAHSGTGEIAFFEELDQLKIGDSLFLTYQEENYEYVVIEIWEEEKNGFIHLNQRKEKQLILTTCHPKKEKKQLIVNGILKESY